MEVSCGLWQNLVMEIHSRAHSNVDAALKVNRQGDFCDLKISVPEIGQDKSCQNIVLLFIESAVCGLSPLDSMTCGHF